MSFCRKIEDVLFPDRKNKLDELVDSFVSWENFRLQSRNPRLGSWFLDPVSRNSKTGDHEVHGFAGTPDGCVDFWVTFRNGKFTVRGDKVCSSTRWLLATLIPTECEDIQGLYDHLNRITAFLEQGRNVYFDESRTQLRREFSWWRAAAAWVWTRCVRA